MSGSGTYDLLGSRALSESHYPILHIGGGVRWLPRPRSEQYNDGITISVLSLDAGHAKATVVTGRRMMDVMTNVR